MASPTIRILLAGPDTGDAGLMREMLAAADRRSFTVECAGTLVSALDVLARGGIDIVLLDLFLPDSRGLETLLTVRAHAPQVPVLVWTGLESPQLAQGAVQAGAQDYLIKNRLTGPALARAIEYAILRYESTAPPAPPRSESVVLGIMGAKGGAGATTLACHLSVELRRVTQDPVLLADLDLYAGQVAFLMKANSPYSVLDAANNLHRLDKDYWTALAAEGAGSVSVLRSPGIGAMDGAPSADRLRHVFRFLRTQYRWIVMDLGRASALSLELAAEVSQLLTVATTEVQQLFEAKQLLERLAAGGMERERIRLVLNRFAARSAVSQADVERALGVPVCAVLPNHYVGLSEAYSDGKLLREGSVLRQQIRLLAANLAGVDAAPGKPRSALLSFFKRSAGASDAIAVPQPSRA